MTIIPASTLAEFHPILTNLLSGFLGALFGGWVTGRYMIWQTGETVRHNLRGIVIQMGVHVQQCKGMIGGDGQYHRTDPWSVYMEEAIAAYLRYRALLLPWQRPALDRAWTDFQGTKPYGDTPYAYAPMTDSQNSLARVTQFLKAID